MAIQKMGVSALHVRDTHAICGEKRNHLSMAFARAFIVTYGMEMSLIHGYLGDIFVRFSGI